MFTYTKEEILYNNGHYNWKTIDNLDNSYYRNGSDDTILNRTEGREILYYINYLAKKWWGDQATLCQYHQIDRLIRYSVPDHFKSHLQIEVWLGLHIIH